MGLLSDPKTRRTFTSLVAKYNNKLCVLCYVIGLGWFLALAYKELNAKTYFSENALLPGLVEPDFAHGFGSSDFLQELKAEVKKLKADDKLRHDVPVDWFQRRFRDIGLDVYAQNYTTQVPFQPSSKPLTYTSQNVYAILQAPRASSTEALVISAPYRTESGQSGSLGGMALMLGLATAFRRHTYWAKDIIFLITTNEEVGMQAWLSAYHHMPADNIVAGELFGRAGAIQAAVNLEISQSSISYLDVKVEGLNGQLPNLDLVNTAVRLCRRENIPPTLHRRSDYWSYASWDGFQYGLRTMLEMMWTLASGMPSANHGLFHRYNIEAVTLHGIKLKGSRPSFGFPEMGRVMEGIMRSLNNLLERFHQSFFFYLLPSTDRYVSIGVYLPPFGILCLPIIIKALALWIEFSAKESSSSEGNESNKENDGEGDKQTSNEAEKQAANSAEKQTAKQADKKADKGAKTESREAENQRAAEADTTTLAYLLSYIPYFLTALFFGLCAFYGPHYFIQSAASMHLKPQQGMAVGLLAVHLAVLSYPAIKKWNLSRRRYRTAVDWPSPDVRVLKCLALLWLGVTLGATSILNISLAFFVSAIWIPVVLIVSPSNSRVSALLQRVALLIISPLGLACLAAIAHQAFLAAPPSANSGQRDLSLVQWLAETWELVGSGLHALVLQAELLSNWTYGLLALAMLPNWVLFTLIVGADPPMPLGV